MSPADIYLPRGGREMELTYVQLLSENLSGSSCHLSGNWWGQRPENVEENFPLWKPEEYHIHIPNTQIYES